MKILEFDPLEATNKKIYIYGTTVGGIVIHRIFNSIGLYPTAYCDRAGKYECYDGLPVVLPQELSEDGAVVISVMRAFDSVCQELESVNIKTAYQCSDMILDYSDARIDLSDLNTQLVESFFSNYPIYAKGIGINPEKIVLPALEVFITERCTLRCRDCSHLIPYYDKPESYKMKDVIKRLSNLLLVVDEIKELLILGGEPLLHPELGELLRWAHSNSKIGLVRIITNATVLPSELLWEDILYAHCELRISDYGKLSIRLDELVRECSARNVRFSVNYEKWTDMGTVCKHDYSVKKLHEVFKNCPFTYVFLLLKDKLYRCAHIAHLNNLCYIDTTDHDGVDIGDVTENNINDKQRKLSCLLSVNYLEGCQYCNGYSDTAAAVEPAIQLGKSDISRMHIWMVNNEE